MSVIYELYKIESESFECELITSEINLPEQILSPKRLKDTTEDEIIEPKQNSITTILKFEGSSSKKEFESCISGFEYSLMIE